MDLAGTCNKTVSRADLPDLEKTSGLPIHLMPILGKYTGNGEQRVWRAKNRYPDDAEFAVDNKFEFENLERNC